ncbi:hypothetical protein EDC94DRAFT_589726 [Helicostylum pulchrum]|nr:hypothetical protein EDC94DRAFT_589726 [Helicostylum pulchrum]
MLVKGFEGESFILSPVDDDWLAIQKIDSIGVPNNNEAYHHKLYNESQVKNIWEKSYQTNSNTLNAMVCSSFLCSQLVKKNKSIDNFVFDVLLYIVFESGQYVLLVNLVATFTRVPLNIFQFTRNILISVTKLLSLDESSRCILIHTVN